MATSTSTEAYHSLMAHLSQAIMSWANVGSTLLISTVSIPPYANFAGDALAFLIFLFIWFVLIPDRYVHYARPVPSNGRATWHLVGLCSSPCILLSLFLDLVDA